MIVVSDTTPLNYLILVDEIEILPRLHGKIIIPDVVQQEMQHPKTPEKVRQWIAHLPDWISVQKPQSLIAEALDAGEKEAISLALELNAITILMDERKGREVALHYGLEISGVIGQLSLAARSGLIDFDAVLHRLLQSNFQISQAIIAKTRASLGLT